MVLEPSFMAWLIYVCLITSAGGWNSFAWNQGDLVYDAFKKYARRFSVFYLGGCEFMTKINTKRKDCTNYANSYFTAVLDELKPDIIFILSRAFTAKLRFNLTPFSLEKDIIFNDYMNTMKKLEKFAKKVYLLQALPSCTQHECAKNVWDYVRKNRPLEIVKKQLIDRDEFFARFRIEEVGKRCKKCEIIDYMPLLLDDSGRYLGYDPENGFLYLDGHNHLNDYAKERIRPLFNRLAEEFGKAMPV
ncbi:unnamed protein product [Cylicocyclus nassatus]|uniref:SGNH domain-containing protein n=1 Tax=Cylicocyclus nassatus TaxID=53992 RepID=A0AA36GPT5_CYLNA|nr:unnamed protein product [Cylicocyclus nassatus]